MSALRSEPATPAAGEDASAPAEPEPPEPLTVVVLREDGDWSGFQSIDPAVATAAHALARHPSCAAAQGCEATVVLGSDALLRRLNRTYRGKDAPTNVLSFAAPTAPGAVVAGPRPLGDVVLAMETVAREAAEGGVAPIHHVQHLVVHGLLHLLGHDHQHDAEAEAMERLETEILASIGVADPYA